MWEKSHRRTKCLTLNYSIMETRKQLCANTQKVLAALKDLQKHDSNGWQDFNGNADIFLKLQEEIRPEREMLKSFWVWDDPQNKQYSGGHVDLTKFYRWQCLPAYYDTPREHLIYMSGHFATTKFDVLHDRECYLDFLQRWIFGLFHSWEFCTQGFTAY